MNHVEKASTCNPNIPQITICIDLGIEPSNFVISSMATLVLLGYAVALMIWKGGGGDGTEWLHLEVLWVFLVDD